MKKIIGGILLFMVFGFRCMAAQTDETDTSGIQYDMEGGFYKSGDYYFKNVYMLIMKPGSTIKPFLYFEDEIEEKQFSSGKDLTESRSVIIHLGYARIENGALVSAGRLAYNDENVSSIFNMRYRQEKLVFGEAELLWNDEMTGSDNTMYISSYGSPRGNIPAFGYLSSEDGSDFKFSEESLQKLADYFVDGNRGNLINADSFSEYPLVDDANTVYDDRLGYLRNCRIKYWKDEKKETLDDIASSDLEHIDERYDFTWDYVPSTGAAGDVDWNGGIGMDDLVDAAKSVRVQMKVDFSAKEWPWEKPQWYKGMDFFSYYEEMPLSTKETYTMRMDRLIEKMKAFSGKKLDGEKYIVFYLRLIRYSRRDGLYHTSNQWVRIQVDGFASISVDTGYFDEDGNFIVDNDSEGSYSLKMDPNGKVTGGDKVPEEFLSPEEKLEVHEEDGWGVIERFIDSMKSFPAFMTRIFGFLPESLRWAVGAVFLSIVGLGVIALVVKILT